MTASGASERVHGDPHAAAQGATGTDRQDGSLSGPPSDPPPPQPTAADRAVLRIQARSVTADRGAIPGLLLAGGGLAVGAGSGGLIAGLLLVVGWLVVPPVYAVTIGAVFVAVLGLPLVWTVWAGIGLGLMLLAAVRQYPVPIPTGGAIAVAAGGLAVVLWVGLRVTSLALTAVLLGGTVAVGLYGLHRYSLVTVVFGDLDD